MLTGATTYRSTYTYTMFALTNELAESQCFPMVILFSMSSCTGSRGKHCQCILPCLSYQNNARHCILSFQVNICVSRTSTVLERKVYPVRSSWEGHHSSCKRLPVEKATVSDTLNYARLNDGATYTGPVRSRCRRHHDCSGSEEDDGLEKVHFKIR